MIGNDVIDILQSRLESNWRRKGFIDKLFTTEERLVIVNAEDSEIMVWVFWSMKEAAYKIYNRKTKIREYIPKKLQCSIEHQNHFSMQGIVACMENMYYTKTTIFNNMIHTVAVTVPESLNKVKEIEKQFVKKDENNIPFYITSENKIQQASVSNHGRFEVCVTIL